MHTHDLYFLTATVVNWKHLLSPKHKSIIIDSLNFMVSEGRVDLYAFVLMPNHIHLIWKIKDGYQRSSVQRDFLRFTSQQILKEIRNNHAEVYESLLANKKDRKRQLWQRGSLNIELHSRKVIGQKLDYIHFNPVRGKWNLANEYTDYHYSSASFYEDNDTKTFPFLKHYMEYWGH